jgi:ABC-type transporter Mla subunit MlaD
MALQDLTPQLRTRLSRVERLVGVFVTVATLLLFAGFAYYVFHTAKSKGWFLVKVRYQTGVNSAEGLVAGAPVILMGKSVGKIVKVESNDPKAYYGLTVTFEVQEPSFGYIWTDSKVKVTSGLLNGRTLEITKGREDWAVPTVRGDSRATYERMLKNSFEKAWNEEIGRLFAAEKAKTGKAVISDDRKEILMQQARYNFQAYANSSEGRTNLYVHWDKEEQISLFFLDPVESQPVSDRLEQIANTVEKALPNFLALTNQLTTILNNAASATAKLDGLLSDVRPAALNLTRAAEELPRLAANVTQITENLTNGQGSLGEWILTSNLNAQIDQTFGGVHTVMGTANTNLLTLNQSLENLSQITSNLAVQVHANTNLLSGVYHLVIDADQMVQGLKQHWFLRSAFK